MKDLLSFFTIVPVRGASLEEAAREAPMLPLVGLVTGLPGAVVLLAADVISPGVTATLALGAVLLAAGMHHADGVLDVGDALMAHGTPDRRREVIADTRVGIGGLGALFLVYAPTVGALAALCAASPGRAALALFAGEVSARSAMLLTLAFGEPADARSSSVPFVKALSGPGRFVGITLALVVPLPFLLTTSALAPLAILTAPLVALGALRIAATKFGGIGGDLVGATGEACRAVLLVLLSATI
ncbi:MAG TPA: adenosylcobinamide-GDP ribazoletransferase [Rubrobacter sp.]|nr:adenosylcobinamide-GDP ribazoletransferase [Rubrobacteraceae bacterium]MDQ3183269.1 adenosylcobinamide-GDP ribazoletransferase [Actinomycetota bacterium]MDQ3499297.1 adenosylcobinamide-GDP ribazoletransferase [Actinomycetota bacterium]HEV8044681.1 adenosylcobinamide-GDP ribazoletransferase [Rubrobacter sp.]